MPLHAPYHIVLCSYTNSQVTTSPWGPLRLHPVQRVLAPWRVSQPLPLSMHCACQFFGSQTFITLGALLYTDHFSIFMRRVCIFLVSLIHSANILDFVSETPSVKKSDPRPTITNGRCHQIGDRRGRVEGRAPFYILFSVHYNEYCARVHLRHNSKIRSNPDCDAH